MLGHDHPVGLDFLVECWWEAINIVEGVVAVSILKETTEVLERVEEESGIPVEVTTDPSLPTLASIKIARAPVSHHVLTYNPTKPGVDYHIAYQCGFVLRLFENPPDERYEFGGTESGRQTVQELLTEQGGIAKKLKLPKATVKQLADQFFDGLLTQLRSVPIGMRIDRWIRETYPVLHEAQEASVDRQQRENAQALNPQIRQMTPPLVFSDNASMNAAYAIFSERLLGKSQYVIPYRSVGFEERGRALLGIWDELPSDARHDRELVDAWAEELELSDWCRWVPLAQWSR